MYIHQNCKVNVTKVKLGLPFQHTLLFRNQSADIATGNDFPLHFMVGHHSFNRCSLRNNGKKNFEGATPSHRISTESIIF